MRMNLRPRMPAATTHEGAPATTSPKLQQLERLVLTCMLWEDTYYVDGVTVAERIRTLSQELCQEGKGLQVLNLATKARQVWNLRHAPLMVLLGMVAACSRYVEEAVYEVCKRADEPGELLSLLRSSGLLRHKTIPRKVRMGLQTTLARFNEYQLAKYDNRRADWKLRDVFRIVRPKPTNEEQSALWKRVIKGELVVPDTWETAISAAGSDQRAKLRTWERLLTENKLGDFALLRNLRNLSEAGVSAQLIRAKLETLNTAKLFPYRLFAAAKHAPQFADVLDRKMLESCSALPKLRGKTAVLVDVSGSMKERMSGKSEMTRLDGAACLAIIFREMCENGTMFEFDTTLQHVSPLYRGAALAAYLTRRSDGGGTLIGAAVTQAQHGHDRVIVLTDEQSSDTVSDIRQLAYMVNLAPYQQGVGFGAWIRINGFSFAVPQYIAMAEGLAVNLAESEQ